MTLLGGRQGKSVELSRSIGKQPLNEMTGHLEKYRSDGYKRFQLKLGGEINDDIETIKTCRSVLNQGEVLVADANTGKI